MHLVLTINKGANGDDGVAGLLNRIKEATDAYSSIDTQYTEKLNRYFQLFGYNMANEMFNPGWLYQIKSTVNGKLVLGDNAYTMVPKELKKLQPGQLFAEKEYHWKTNLLSNDTYSPFVDKLKEKDTEPTEQQNVTATNEKFIAHMYNAIQTSPSEAI